MQRSLRILRPLDKFLGEKRLPGDIFRPEQLQDVSLASLDALVGMEVAEYVTEPVTSKDQVELEALPLVRPKQKQEAA